MRARLIFIIFSVLILIAGCTSPSNPLVGKWQKISEAECNTMFIPPPSETLEFFSDGTYTGSIFGIPGGTYEIVEGRIKVQGPFNVNAVFEFSISEDALIIKDDDKPNCQVQYRLTE